MKLTVWICRPVRMTLVGTLLACLAGASAGESPATPAELASAAPWLDASGSGFLTLAAGKIFNGTAHPATDLGYHCPCEPVDYSQGGIYQAGGWQLAPESRLGVQGSVNLRDAPIALTGQVVSRGTRNGRANLEWLYANTTLSDSVSLQLGRKRLPFFAESEVQDVGYAYPWVHLPPQVYGWEITNYNGANLRINHEFAALSAELNVFGGGETVDNSRYEQVYYGPDSRSRVRWPHIQGIEARAKLDGLELHAIWLSSDTQYQYVTSGDQAYSSPKHQRVYAASAIYDRDGWVAYLEGLYIDRHADYGGDHAQLAALGHRFGLWLPMLSWSRYRQSTETVLIPAEGHDLSSLVLRRELGDGAALKLQYDHWSDDVAAGFVSPHGQTRMLSLAYVRVF